MFEALRKTVFNAFGIGIGGPDLENDSGHLKVTNGSGTLRNIRAAAPSGSSDVVTKGYADSNYGAPAGVLREIKIGFDYQDSGALTSTAQLPVDAIVSSVDVVIFDAFDDGGVAIKVGLAADDDLYASLAASLSEAAESYSYNARSPTVSSAEAPRVTVTPAGTPTVGEGMVIITYSVPAT